MCIRDSERYLRQERRSVNVKRSYYVGDTFTEEDINASLENGVLTLNFPKEGTKQEQKMCIRDRITRLLKER